MDKIWTTSLATFQFGKVFPGLDKNQSIRVEVRHLFIDIYENICKMNEKLAIFIAITVDCVVSKISFNGVRYKKFA